MTLDILHVRLFGSGRKLGGRGQVAVHFVGAGFFNHCRGGRRFPESQTFLKVAELNVGNAEVLVPEVSTHVGGEALAKTDSDDVAIGDSGHNFTVESVPAVVAIGRSDDCVAVIEDPGLAVDKTQGRIFQPALNDLRFPTEQRLDPEQFAGVRNASLELFVVHDHRQLPPRRLR